MLTRLMRTGDDTAATILRLVLGLVMFPHAAQKVFGWFGGPGFGDAVGFFSSMGMPKALAVLVILVEFFGSVLLILGLASRVGAAFITIIMLGAILTVHLHNGFFMNWFGSQAGEGFEYHLLAIGIAVAVMIRGGGRISLDRMITAEPTS